MAHHGSPVLIISPMFVCLAAAENQGPVLPVAAPKLFEIPIGPFSLPITNSMVLELIVAVLIILVVRLGTRRLLEVPDGLQNFIEFIIEGLENLLKTLLEPKVVRWAFPLIATYFLLILSSNLIGLLPGVGSIGYGVPSESGAYAGFPFAIKHAHAPLFRAPTADANLTVAMSLIFFVMSLVWAIRYHGLGGFLFHMFGPKGGLTGYLMYILMPVFWVVGFIEVISLLVRPVALSMRLFGNVYGGESVMTIMLGMGPFGCAAIPFYFFEVMVGVVQATVFTLLCIAFLGSMCSHTEEHKEDELGEGGHH